MGLDALSWYEVAKDRSRWHDLCQTISSEGVARDPTVVTGSFVCGCGRIFNCSGDLTRHRKCCSGQPPTQNKQNSTLDVAECSIAKVISPGTSNTAQAKVQFFGTRTLLLSTDRLTR